MMPKCGVCAKLLERSLSTPRLESTSPCEIVSSPVPESEILSGGYTLGYCRGATYIRMGC